MNRTVGGPRRWRAGRRGCRGAVGPRSPRRGRDCRRTTGCRSAPSSAGCCSRAGGLRRRALGGGRAQRSTAAELLRSAQATSVALEAAPSAERCARELEAYGLAPAKRGVMDREDLTPQERSVARLVASGLANREVAAELLVSVKTVEVHLTRIYAKLGVKSRAQLAVHVRGSSAEGVSAG